MVGFDLARTFNPPTRLGSATGIVNVGGFLASLSTIDPDRGRPGPRGPRRARAPTPSTRSGLAMSVQYLVWVLGVVQILRFRRRTRRAIAESEDGAVRRDAALRGPLRLSARRRPAREAGRRTRAATRVRGPDAHRDHFVIVRRDGRTAQPPRTRD